VTDFRSMNAEGGALYGFFRDMEVLLIICKSSHFGMLISLVFISLFAQRNEPKKGHPASDCPSGFLQLN